jgi:ABC-2 type transport system ATP-binding protein
MSDAVAVTNLSKNFGDFTAVDDVTFTVKPGEIFGFLGPNGAGKTTTIKMLTGLTKPSAGIASVVGFDVTTQGAQLKSQVGYMSQLFSLYADLTVLENITLFGGLYGVTSDRLNERTKLVLEMADLVGREQHITGSLPLGWKQRLALGCAILHEPPVLFLDEPTSGVDPIARRAFWDLIDGLSAGGTTVFVSTHYMEEAEYCHRLAFMNRGALIALDSPDALRAGMTEPILEVSNVDPPQAVEALQSVPGILEAAMFGRNIHVVLEDATEAHERIRRALLEAGITGVPSSRPISPSLEDVFVSHVRRVGGVISG